MGLERYWSDKDIIVYPRGRPEEGPSRSRSNPGDTPYGMRDLAFFDTIVTDLSEHYCIDMDQIHVVGHSLGAWFANSLSCLRGDVIRSSATVGGAARIVDRCAGPSAALLMHHPDDRLAYF
jgi:poly(3-hydroxybutyrate) depolymerase